MRFITVILILFYTIPAFAGSIEMSSIGPFSSWESDCSKPYAPSFFVTDTDSYNYAVDEFNSYLTDVEYYIQCVQNEASDDARALANAIEKGTQNAIDEVSSELDMARSNLQMSKSSLY